MDATTKPRTRLPTTGPGSTGGSGPDVPRRARGGPFATQAPALVVAAVALVASQVWLVAGDALPGGRWFAVHLVTLGVLSPVVLVFSQHFAATLTHVDGDAPRWHAPAFALAALGVLVALPSGTTWLLGLSASAATGVVLASWWRLRTARRAAVGARFGWVVRGYERAHGAFVHGAVLGALLGTFVLPGAWHESARLAHLHVMLLGWTGLTLLSTLVFFGPTMLRTRIVDGADRFAFRWLGHGATALTLGVVALLLTGLGGVAGTAARLVAAAALALFAGIATRVLWDVVQAALAAKPTAVQGPLLGTLGWLVLALWADVAVVATAAWDLLALVGLVALAGVFVPAVLSTVTYLAPLLRARTTPGRDAVRSSLERHAAARAVVFHGGVLAMLAAGVLAHGGADGAVLLRTGWVLAVGAVLHLAFAGSRPLPDHLEDKEAAMAAPTTTPPPTGTDAGGGPSDGGRGRRPLFAGGVVLASVLASLLAVSVVAGPDPADAPADDATGATTDDGAAGDAGEAPTPVDAAVVSHPGTDVGEPVGDRAPTTVRLELETVELEGRMADGSAYTYWTFDGTVPGPLLRVREGDAVELTLANDAASSQIHSIDLHAVNGPGGGAVATQVPPGEDRTFTFTALNPGVYVYHCATPHIPTHVANGMYGLIVVEPEGGLPEVDRELYVMQGELYTDAERGTPGLVGFDGAAMTGEDPTHVVFNGAVGSLTGDAAMHAQVGETVRIYVGNGGPNLTSSFHVIGEVFDRAAVEGGSLVNANVQTTLVPAGGATWVEFTLDVPGDYLLVDHALSRAIDGGAVAIVHATGEGDPAVFDAPEGTDTAGH